MLPQSITTADLSYPWLHTRPVATIRRKKPQIISLLLLLMLFAGSTTLRFLLTDYTKCITVTPDELLYYQIAESFATGRGLPVVNNYLTNFQKILYPLVIAPAFLVGNTVQQHIRAIALINSLVMSSCIFPSYLLASRLKLKRFARFGIALLSIYMWDMSYTASFLSEVLYYPLTLWVVYGYLVLLDNDFSYKQTLALACLLGVLTYLLYACKEVGLVLPCALAVVGGFRIVHEWLVHGVSYTVKRLLAGMVCLALLFVVCHVIMRSFFVGSLSTNYQLSKQLSVVFQRLPYFARASVAYAAAIVIAAGLLPVAFPLIMYKRLPPRSQLLFQLVGAGILICIAVVVLTISITEDYGSTTPRLHLRYFVFAWIPLLCVFFALHEQEEMHLGRTCTTGYVLFVILTAYVFSSFSKNAFIDCYLVTGLAILKKTLGGALMCTVFIVLAILAVTLLHFPKILTAMFAIGYLVFQCYTGVVAYSFQHATKHVSDVSCIQYEQLKAYIHEHQDEHFALLLDWPATYTSCLAEMYFNEPNVYVIDTDQLIASTGGKQLHLSDASIPVFPAAFHAKDSGYELEHIDYLLIPKSQSTQITTPPLESCTLPGASSYRAYKNSDTARLPGFDNSTRLLRGAMSFPAADGYFESIYHVDAQGVLTAKEPGKLAEGPGAALSAGSYTLRLEYEYYGHKEGVVGAVTTFGIAPDPLNCTRCLFAHENEIVVDNIQIPMRTVLHGETSIVSTIRLHALTKGLSLRSVTLTKTS